MAALKLTIIYPHDHQHYTNVWKNVRLRKQAEIYLQKSSILIFAEISHCIIKRRLLWRFIDPLTQDKHRTWSCSSTTQKCQVVYVVPKAVWFICTNTRCCLQGFLCAVLVQISSFLVANKHKQVFSARRTKYIYMGCCFQPEIRRRNITVIIIRRTGVQAKLRIIHVPGTTQHNRERDSETLKQSHAEKPRSMQKHGNVEGEQRVSEWETREGGENTRKNNEWK